ncbi:N-acetylmuramoyl-L-alanine amidase [Acidaminococcus sp. NSJ-142]|jgi:hypothetical protein|uniref:N-acetylmuramoyl-L-alanine amidase n=1 Tax=Acidaminococcus hominis TaxID=2897706 RepID=UPI001E401B40|nr:N-acetylmuramoyl-L-alanine amidase [Acidaminococcus hominis]MCD2434778.1 N-acetylmuramoyl-L-alanine amidase [Acidaminococcus hominis]
MCEFSKVKQKEIEMLAARARGQLEAIYVHWTAGNYTQLFDDYHLLITGDGAIYSSTDDWTQVLAHTWNRNTGALGIALCCAYDARMYGDCSYDLGPFPPTKLQVESTSLLLALLSRKLGIPIDSGHMMTHAEAADLDGYGPWMAGTPQFEKWDLYELQDYDGVWKPGGDVLRGKALYYTHFLPLQ